MADEIKNVFISHIHENDADVQTLKELMGDKQLEFRDASIDSSDPNNAINEQYIKSEYLAPGIKWAGTVIVLVSEKTHESDWVNWEIEFAEKEGKRIVGIWLPGAEGSTCPDALNMYADAVVPWDADQIAGAISGDINNWTRPDGRERDSQPIKRHGC